LEELIKNADQPSRKERLHIPAPSAFQIRPIRMIQQIHFFNHLSMFTVVAHVGLMIECGVGGNTSFGFFLILREIIPEDWTL
jgi:hypothetical protein